VSRHVVSCPTLTAQARPAAPVSTANYIVGVHIVGPSLVSERRFGLDGWPHITSALGADNVCLYGELTHSRYSLRL